MTEQQGEQAQRGAPMRRLTFPSGRIPSWFIGLAVVVTAAVTVWAMWKRNDGVWTTSSVPMKLAQAASPMAQAMGQGGFGQGGFGPGPRAGGSVGVGNGAGAGQYRIVAGNRPIPTIQVGMSSKHEERGACTLCHVVVDKVGSVIPMIGAYSALPHPYRGGLCINCHKVRQKQTRALLPMAATRPMAPIARPAAPQPTEAAWMGMEVAPITPLTAGQYNIPKAIKGLVVTEVEATARMVGVQAGDVVVGVNEVPVPDMLTFVEVTRKGALPQGSVQLLRGGKFMRAKFGAQGAAAPAAGLVPNNANNNVNNNMAINPQPNMPQRNVAGNVAVPQARGNYRAGTGRGLGTGPNAAACPNRF